MCIAGEGSKELSPTVGDSAAVPTHSQALLQVGGKAGRSNTATAIGANTLLALPLVENLSKDVQPRLVHDLWGQERRGDQSRQGTLLLFSSRQGPMSSLNSSLPKLTGAPGSASRAVSRKPSESHPSYPHLPTLGRTRPLSFHPEAHQNPSCYQDLYHPGRSSRT